MTVTPKPIHPALLFAVWAGCGEPPVQLTESTRVAIVGARLIAGTSAPPISDAVVVIRDGRIEAVGTRADTSVPSGTEVFDGTGKTVVPGFVETHAQYHGDLARVDE